jgi:FkbM family methyltransferase
MNFKKSIKDYLVRPLFESLNIDTYSRPALNALDRKLEKYLDSDNGVFLEIGANDGFKQSNTYYFEKMRNWRGILIEPIPMLYERCKKRRKRSEVYNYLCGSPEDAGKVKTIQYADLMSQVKGAFNDGAKESEHINRGLQIQKIENSYSIELNCLTISEIIDKSSFDHIDLMTVDVEGYELEVLKGLDLERHAPNYLLVEAWEHERELVIDYLSSHYSIAANLSSRDILFKQL